MHWTADYTALQYQNTWPGMIIWVFLDNDASSDAVDQLRCK